MDKSDNNDKRHDIPENTSLGSLLRRAREERQIDLDEAVRATRITRPNLEALENEEWSKLPSGVFVKGFLRSYAGFLGLDKEMVLNFYLKASPSYRYRPHTLEEISLQPRRLHLIILIPVLALCLIGSIVYLKGRNISVVEKAFQYLVTQSPVSDKEYGVERKVPAVREGVGEHEEVAGETPPISNPDVESEAPGDSTVLEETKDVSEEQTTLISKPGEEPEVVERPAIVKETEGEKPLSAAYTLTAHVNSRTWIAIYIDEGPAKEYLFQPGDTMRWTAYKGFDILVGNAGGIEFSLNGEAVGNLGPEGKVVRLKLPEAI
jgi:cytoskeleton protein RodZ